MPNNTRNNSKNKSYSTKNENDRFGEIIDYICAQHNINQNELIEKINNYMGFNFLADNTLLIVAGRNGSVTQIPNTKNF